MRGIILSLLAVGMLLGGLSASASTTDPVVFAHRENVNLLDTWDPNVKIFHNPAHANGGPIRNVQFRTAYDNNYYLPRGITGMAGDIWLGVDFGRLRNVETVTVYEATASQAATSFEIWVSEDGVTYSKVSDVSVAANATLGAGFRTITLSEAVDTQFLRIVPTGFTNPNEWRLDGVRIFGAPGELTLSDITNAAGQGVIDLLASTGMAKNADGSLPIVFSVINMPTVQGTAFIGGSTQPVYLDDKAFFGRSTFYPLIVADRGFEIEFTSGQLYEFSTFRVSLTGWQTSTVFTLYVLDAKGDWTAVPAYTEASITAANVVDGTIYDFVLGGMVGSGIRLVVDDPGTATGTQNMFLDMQLFGTPVIPEPATISLLALGGLTLLRRRR